MRLGVDYGDYEDGKPTNPENIHGDNSRGSKGTLLRHVHGARKVRVIHSLARQKLALPRRTPHGRRYALE